MHVLVGHVARQLPDPISPRSKAAAYKGAKELCSIWNSPITALVAFLRGKATHFDEPSDQSRLFSIQEGISIPALSTRGTYRPGGDKGDEQTIAKRAAMPSGGRKAIPWQVAFLLLCSLMPRSGLSFWRCMG
jgi:hypothetical protein